MLDPRLRLRVSTIAELSTLFEQLFLTFLAHWRTGWREASAQLEREVWRPLERVFQPAWLSVVAALKREATSLSREAAALSATALALWHEGLAHLHLEWRGLGQTLRRVALAQPAWVKLRARVQLGRERLAKAANRASLVLADSLDRAQARLIHGATQAATLIARIAAKRLPIGLKQTLETAWAASRPWQRQFVRFSQGPVYANVVSLLIVAAYLSLALTSLAIVALAASPLPPLAEPQPKLQPAAYLSQSRVLNEYATLTPTPSPTPPPTATPQPTPTLEPVLTATPIPIVYTTWDSTLPQYGGWNGAGECWGPVLAPTGTGAFAWPSDKRYLVGKNFSWRWHPGLDLGGEFDDPIYAADSGVVVYAGWNTYGYGNLVILDHGNGWHTLYAHFNSVLVACGEAVTQGQIIGLAGSTGRSTGPHLHFEMRLGGAYVNPWDYLPPP